MTSARVSIDVVDGTRLDAEVIVPHGAVAAAVLTHPHPMMGGDMTNPVTAGLATALAAAGVAVLRFDFRGTGASTGTHEGGTAEAEDVRAAANHLVAASGLPGVWIVGYSFGADVATQVIDPVVVGWVLVAPPLRTVPPSAMLAGDDDRPTLLVVGAHDQFLPPAAAREATTAWRSTEVVEVPGADHFFAGRVAPLAELVTARLAGAG